MQRIIWLRGPWYSPIPAACRIRCLVAAQHPRHGRRDADRSPGPRGMIIGAGRVLDQTGAIADLIGGGEVGRELCSGQAGSCLGDGEQCRKDRRAGMALGVAVGVMRIDGVDGEGSGHCRPGRRDRAPVHQHARGSGGSGAEEGQRALPRDARKIGRGADRRDAHGVEEAATQHAQHIRGNIFGPQLCGEPRHVDGHCALPFGAGWPPASKVSSGWGLRLIGLRPLAGGKPPSSAPGQSNREADSEKNERCRREPCESAGRPSGARSQGTTGRRGGIEAAGDAARSAMARAEYARPDRPIDPTG